MCGMQTMSDLYLLWDHPLDQEAQVLPLLNHRLQVLQDPMDQVQEQVHQVPQEQLQQVLQVAVVTQFL